MDDVDFLIVGHLFERPLDGPEQLARQVGLSRNAVSRRMRLLQEGPVRLGFFALPHHSLLGRTSTVNLHATDGDVDGDAALACDDVLAYDLNHDGLCAVTTWQAGPATPSPRLERLLGPAVARFTDATPGPAAPYLTRLEWKVVQAWCSQPRASAAALARATGLAPRTCERARSRLQATRAMRAGITLREDGVRGPPVFRLFVQGHPDAARLERALGQSFLSDVVAEGQVRFARAASAGALVVATEAVRRLPGVADVKLILSRRFGLAQERLDGWIQQRLAAAGKVAG